jgi:hypothetical protein
MARNHGPLNLRPLALAIALAAFALLTLQACTLGSTDSPQKDTEAVSASDTGKVPYVGHWEPVGLIIKRYSYETHTTTIDTFGIGSTWIRTGLLRLLSVETEAIVEYNYSSTNGTYYDEWSVVPLPANRWLQNDIDTLVMTLKGDTLILDNQRHINEDTGNFWTAIYRRYTGAYPPAHWVPPGTRPPDRDSV